MKYNCARCAKAEAQVTELQATVVVLAKAIEAVKFENEQTDALTSYVRDIVIEAAINLPAAARAYAERVAAMEKALQRIVNNENDAGDGHHATYDLDCGDLTKLARNALAPKPDAEKAK